MQIFVCVLSVHMQTHAHSRQINANCNMCSKVNSCADPLKYHPQGYDVMRIEGVSNVCASNAKRSQHMEVVDHQLSLILPHGFLLANGVNCILMYSICVCVSLSCQYHCALSLHHRVCDICRKWEPFCYSW